MSESDLYSDDIVLGSEQQAEVLRRRVANQLDWVNLAEERAWDGANCARSRLSSSRRCGTC
jgi:hypothetical protein